MTAARARGGAERGFAAMELVLGIGVLLLPVALIVLTIPTWSERQTTARVMAREIARAAAARGMCDRAAARGLAVTMAENLGLPAGDAQVDLDCVQGAALSGGSDVQAIVPVRMPAVHIAAVGDVGEWEWTARHRQPVDPYVGAP